MNRRLFMPTSEDPKSRSYIAAWQVSRLIRPCIGMIVAGSKAGMERRKNPVVRAADFFS
jgi:hypothetical protein